MSTRTCHVLLALAFAGILIGLIRVGWWITMSL